MVSYASKYNTNYELFIWFRNQQNTGTLKKIVDPRRTFFSAPGPGKMLRILWIRIWIRNTAMQRVLDWQHWWWFLHWRNPDLSPPLWIASSPHASLCWFHTFDCAKRVAWIPKDVPLRVFPIHVMLRCRRLPSMGCNTSCRDRLAKGAHQSTANA